MTRHADQGHTPAMLHEKLLEQVAFEKINYMRNFAKSSTVATIIAPLLCIPLYNSPGQVFKFSVWLSIMALAVVVRIILIDSIDFEKPIASNFLKLNWSVGIVTLTWGVGWFFLVPNMDMANYLIYQIISLSVLFVGMVGYCVNWKTFYSFILPLKLPELAFICFNYHLIVWPIALGSMTILFLALRMGVLFSKSWEKSISLRYENNKLLEELTLEKDASIAANVAKSEFIATASHDLRQPMQAINILVELFSASQLPERERSIFQKMKSSISVLNRMFSTLLDISKLDSSLKPDYENFELATVVDDLALTFSPLAFEKGLTLDFQNENIQVHGDRNLTDQILRNLLANAIQYTSAGGVSVRFSDVLGRLHISVEDTGCGIPEEDLPFIYKEFFRSQFSRSQHDGLGLGLSIVRSIVGKIGGQLSLVTEPHVGTIFKVDTQFPILSVRQSRGALSQVLVSNRSHQNLIGAAVEVKHLGLIENDKSLMSAYVSYFSSLGYEVHPIPHTEAGFKEALLYIPRLDFILSDYRLEVQDGVYFIETLREEFNEVIPACIVTADTSPQHLNMFKDLRIEVLYKPIEIQSISSFIASRLK